MSFPPFRWHVLGAGALGSLWSARLARIGQDRMVRPILILKDETWSGLGRPSECKIHVDEQRRCENGAWSIDVSSQPLSAADPIRRLLIATKAPDVYNALHGVINRLEHDAVVVVLCNGMGVDEELISNERFRNISYMLAVTTNGVYTSERFKCVHAGLGDTWVGKPMNSLISAADACSTVGSLQQLSGLPVKLDEDINRRLWEKLSVNASINGITAIMNCRNGEIMETAHGISLVTNLCSEVCQVMEASGIPPSTSVSSVLEIIQKTSANFSSMQQDMMLGRPTEIDYINGFVVKKGHLLGVPTPTNLAIVDLVKMKERLQS